MINAVMIVSYIGIMLLFFLFALGVHFTVRYRDMLMLYFVRSNGFADDWNTVSETVKRIDGNPFPEMTQEIYENERRKYIERLRGESNS